MCIYVYTTASLSIHTSVNGHLDFFHVLAVYGILKNGKNGLIYKTEIETQVYKTNLWVLGESQSGDKLGNWA